MAFRAALLSLGRIVLRLTIGRVTPFTPREKPDVKHSIVIYLRLPRPTPAPALMGELQWHRSWAEEPGYVTGNPPKDYGQIRGGCSFPWMIAVDQCTRTMPYSMQLTKQIPNDCNVGGQNRPSCYGDRLLASGDSMVCLSDCGQWGLSGCQ